MTPPSLVLLASRYRIGEPLGSGGMATVYDALDERLERPVAVKVLRPDMAARPDVRARFESEARSAAQLTHPNVVAVFDTGEDEGTPFIVMERLPGETLGDRLQAGPVETDWVLRLAGDVLGALGAAHAAGIVHRDVKPGNILIAADGCAKVGDFGIAKSLEVAVAADLTSTNQLVGTPAYVAPERVVGKPATPRSDLYAVGVVLYEALGRRKPFTGKTPVATAYAISHETPPALGSLRDDLPPHVIAAVERAMERDPSRRFATAAEFAAALGVGIAGVPATALTDTDTDATVLAAAGAGATQVLPVIDGHAGVPLSALVPGAGDPTDDGPRRKPFFADRRRLLLGALGGLVAVLLLFALVAAAGRDGDGSGDGDPGSDTATTVATTPSTAPPTTVAPPPAPAADTDQPRSKGKGKKGDDDDDD